jgi:hypothetical protein
MEAQRWKQPGPPPPSLQRPARRHSTSQIVRPTLFEGGGPWGVAGRPESPHAARTTTKDAAARAPITA